MDNQNRFIIFLVSSVLIVMGWYLVFPPPVPQEEPATQTTQTAAPAVSTEAKASTKEQTAEISNVKKVASSRKTQDVPATEVNIETDDYIATFSNQGAVLTGFQLKKYLNRASKKFSQLVNADPNRPKPFSVNYAPLPELNQKSFEVIGSSKKLSKNGDKAELVFKYVDNNGTVFEKKFGFSHGSYMIDFNISVSQTGRNSLQASSLAVEWADTLGAEENTGTNSRTGGYRVATLAGEKVSSETAKKSQDSVEIASSVAWTALADQFFMAALIPDSSNGGGTARILRDHNAFLSPTSDNPNPGVDKKLFAPRPVLVFAGKDLRNGESFQRKGQVYFGPQDYKILKGQNLGLENVIDFGMFGFISVYMLSLLNWFFTWAHNWGLAIILLSIAVKLLLWWPTHNSYKQMAQTQGKMKEIQPKLEAIKRKYADDKQEQQKQTMALYQTAGINPMGGCLPMLLQMPIFFALYSTLSHCIELREAKFLWLGDLTLSDPTYVLPLLMGASMVIQQKVSGQMANQAAGQQKVMMWMMPIMLTWFSFQWPAGLLVYWVVTNILSMVQQKVVNREIQKAKKKDEVAKS